MDTNQPDHELKHLFHEMRQRDAARAPSFAQVTRSASAPNWAQPRAFRLWKPALAAAVVVIVSAIALISVIRYLSSAETKQWAALSKWEASSDVLLSCLSTPWNGSLRTQTDQWLQINWLEIDPALRGIDANQMNQKETP